MGFYMCGKNSATIDININSIVNKKQNIKNYRANNSNNNCCLQNIYEVRILLLKITTANSVYKK